ncbi:MAG: N-6 DNA methylase, partial [Bergeyella sp.]
MSNQAILNPVSDDISVLEGSKNELVVFGNRNDTQSFLELLKFNKQENNRTLIALNSIENTKKFLNRFQNFDGKIFLCLNGNRSGNVATEKILAEFKNKNIKDIRLLYGISENGNQNLSGYLQNKINFQEKNPNLVEPKKSENADRTESNRISETQHLERETPERNIGEPRQNSQSEQNGNHRSGQNLGSNNAGNGLAVAERSDLGNGGRGRPISDVENLIEQYKGQKLTNKQVAEVVSAACFVSGDKKILLKENLEISDDLKEICGQYKSGGTAKEGRGILDEYYTDSKIVEAVQNLIKDEFKGKNEISVLEPSVGTGNFLNAAKNLGIKTNITAFEINETTAKIAKILHPETDINLRSFETEFIDEKGLRTNPENYQNQYDLIIGNPPYGDHRGLYKGLGEEPKISKYEDYFVKRSLDVLKDGGTLAMVLPSGWLNRQNNLKNAEITNAFRLPIGAFSGTQIGTDIIILKKNSQKISEDISKYFEVNPTKILGETKEKTNRFGRLENYIYGSLENALLKIEQFKNQTETEKVEKTEKTEKIEETEKTGKIGNLFEDFVSENKSEN